jgi:hypothetical protein
VLDRLKWMRDSLAPTLAAALKVLGPVELKPLMAQALHMGDEVHNRNAAASGLLLKRLVPAILKSGVKPADAPRRCEFIAGNDPLSSSTSRWPRARRCWLPRANVPGASMVSVMCRNGVEFGIRLSGTGAKWFTAPAPVVDGLYFPGYSKADAAGDLGRLRDHRDRRPWRICDGGRPAIVKFVGGTPADALANTLAMGHITLGRNSAFTLPR